MTDTLYFKVKKSQFYKNGRLTKHSQTPINPILDNVKYGQIGYSAITDEITFSYKDIWNDKRRVVKVNTEVEYSDEDFIIPIDNGSEFLMCSENKLERLGKRFFYQTIESLSDEIRFDVEFDSTKITLRSIWDDEEWVIQAVLEINNIYNLQNIHHVCEYLGQDWESKFIQSSIDEDLNFDLPWSNEPNIDFNDNCEEAVNQLHTQICFIKIVSEFIISVSRIASYKDIKNLVTFFKHQFCFLENYTNRPRYNVTSNSYYAPGINSSTYTVSVNLKNFKGFDCEVFDLSENSHFYVFDFSIKKWTARHMAVIYDTIKSSLEWTDSKYEKLIYHADVFNQPGSSPMHIHRVSSR